MKRFNKRPVASLIEIAVIGLAIITLSLTGCGDPATGDLTTPGGNELPAAKGANALSGKTYIDWERKIEFSTTNEGAASGTYKVLSAKMDDNWQPILENGKYTYIVTETGNYSWNEDAKTVTTTPKEIAFREENGYGALQSKAGYRAAMQAMLDGYKNQMGEAAFNAALKEEGFSSVAAYLNYLEAEAFKNVTRNYAFSPDNKALFLDEALPTNKGTNELTGQTYNSTTWNGGDKPVKDTTRTYAFTATDCTYTQTGEYSYSQTYIYAYDSTAKRVYLKTPTDGREAYYNQWSNNTTNTDNFASADEYNAAQVNSRYGRLEEHRYDLKEKTLQ